jgi:hypothetical protein
MKCSGTIGCALLSAVLLAGTVSCAKKTKKTDKPVPAASATTEAATAGLKFKPTDAQQQIIDGLLTRLNRENWRFPSKDTNAPENARLFTYLAATSKDPAVIGAALTAMYGAYSSHSKRKAKPDADFVTVVNEHLATKDPKIATRALLAARTGMAGKDASPQLITTVASLASRDPYRSGPGRYAVIDALRVISATQRTPEVVKIFEQSLDSSDTYVVSYALQALYRATRSIENRNELKGKVLGMAKHEDPGVRGRALELLGALGRDDQEVLKTVLAALSDPSPYVRSEAAQAVARLRYRPAIHALVKLVDDKESNRYDIRNWTMLDGKPGRLHHDGSPWSRVDDAAMNAIRSLSGGELKLERVNPKEIEKTLDANAATTKAWYAKEKRKIPPLNLQSPELQSSAAVPSGKAPSKQAPAATAKKPTGPPPAAPKPPAPAKPAPPAGSP